MVICLELGADLHMAQLMPLPLTVSCFSKIQIGFAFLIPAHPGKRAVKRVCVCVCVFVLFLRVFLAQCKPSVGFSDAPCCDFQPANILLDENGHVRISDLGLACDFSKKKPHASV